MIFRAFVGVNLINCTLLHVYILSVRPNDQLRRQLAHGGLLLVVLFKVKRDRLLTDAEFIDESFDFHNGKHLFIALLTWIYERLLKFSPLCRDNLQDCIFLIGINHWLLAFFLPIFILFIFLPMFIFFISLPIFILFISFPMFYLFISLPMFSLFISLPMFTLKMYSQNDETGILEVLGNEIIFTAQP